MNPTDDRKAKGKIHVLKLERETLRELDAGELRKAQGGAPRTLGCEPTDSCTRRRCSSTKRC